MSISATIPTYRQLNQHGFFCPDGYLIEEGVAFEFDGEPNEHMEALNEPAKMKLVKYYQKLDAGRLEVAERDRKLYTEADKQPSIGEATADARRISLEKNDGGIPLLGGTKNKKTVKEVTLPQGDKVIKNFTSTKE